MKVPEFKAKIDTRADVQITELIRGDLNFGWIYDNKKNSILIGKLFDINSEPIDTKMYIEYVPQ